MSDASQSRQQKHERWVLDYCARNHVGDGAPLRSAFGDAAGMADAIAHDIKQEHRLGRGGRVTKEMRVKIAVAKRIGDALWALREKITP